MSTTHAVRTTECPNLLRRGKVRDLYDLGDRMMIVASDRISAFDVIMNEPVPGKGIVLTELTRFWLEQLSACVPHHLDYIVDDDRVPGGYRPFIDQLRRRAMVVYKADVLPVECVVRGYLSGSGWAQYKESGVVCGVKLPAGLEQSAQLPEPIFTPTTKADAGHDEPISFEQACEMAGEATMKAARERSLAIYNEAAELAESRGLILADTKFEFGVHDGELMLVDEVLTPDSSRFWPADGYAPGRSQPAFDKQFLRDYLNGLDWPKQPPPPTIPGEIIEQTRARYLEGFERLTGRAIEL
jgi:phosphoribosylaminoimidazole-succinocarboxamide synthase